ncbi:MAG TPA: hypothetical protein VFA85_01170 [Terriglobales bacterium]|nr:hypothetical protein [Terriglobales bacterium]
MEIAHTTLQISWRIEPKPGGGYIARCSDATVPPLEGATQAELQQQIRERLNAQLATRFPNLKIALDKSSTKSDALDVSQSMESGVKPALENWVAKNIAAIIEGKLPPELAEQLKAQAHDGKLQFTVTTTTTTSHGTNMSTKVISAGDEKQPLTLESPDQIASNALQPATPVSASFSNSQLDTGSPIIPANNNSFLRFLLAALVLFGLFFLFTHLKK